MELVAKLFTQKRQKVSMRDMVVRGSKTKATKKAYIRASKIAREEQKETIKKAKIITSKS